MGTRSAARRTSKTGRLRALGNIARVRSAKAKPTKPQTSGTNYAAKFKAAMKRQQKRERRREEHERYLKEKARKEIFKQQEEHRAKASDERARVRAEREAQKKRR